MSGQPQQISLIQNSGHPIPVVTTNVQTQSSSQVSSWGGPPPLITRFDLKFAFDQYDKDRNGTISVAELQEYYKARGTPLDQFSLDYLFKKYDKDQNGSLNFDEFVSFLGVGQVQTSQASLQPVQPPTQTTHQETHVIHPQETKTEAPQEKPKAAENSLPHLTNSQIEDEENENHEIQEMLKNNVEFVKETNKKHPKFFKTLGAAHTPRYLLIGCSDARIQPNSLLKMNPGEIFIHRNIANQVFQGDLNVNAVIQYAIEGLGIRDIIVMGHSKCGGIAASTKKIDFEIVDQWVSTVREIYDSHEEYFKNIKRESQRLDALGKINVRHQCMNVRKNAALRRVAKLGGKVRIHGWYLDTSTGLIETLRFNDEYTKKIAEMHSDILLKYSSKSGVLEIPEVAESEDAGGSRKSSVHSHDGHGSHPAPHDAKPKEPAPVSLQGKQAEPESPPAKLTTSQSKEQIEPAEIEGEEKEVVKSPFKKLVRRQTIVAEARTSEGMKKEEDTGFYMRD